MKKINSFATVVGTVACLSSMLFLSACHTFQGVGKDVQKGGQVIQSAATPSNWPSKKTTATRTRTTHKAPHHKVIKRTHHVKKTAVTSTPSGTYTTTSETTTPSDTTNADTTTTQTNTAPNQNTNPNTNNQPAS